MHVIHEQHGAAQPDAAHLAHRQAAVGRGADAQLHIAKGLAHGLRVGAVGHVHPGDVAGLRGTVELCHPRLRHKRLQLRRVLAHPAGPADQDQTGLGQRGPALALRHLHQQQKLAGHGHQGAAGGLLQLCPGGFCRKFLLHPRPAPRPQPQHGGKQKQRMADAPWGQHRAGELRPKGLRGDGKAFHPRAVVAAKPLGLARAARGKANVERHQVWRCSPVGGQSGHRRLHRLGNGRGPGRIANGRTTATGQHGQKLHQSLDHPQVQRQQHGGRGLLARRLPPLRRLGLHPLVQLGKGELLALTGQGHGLGLHLGPVRDAIVD